MLLFLKLVLSFWHVISRAWAFQKYLNSKFMFFFINNKLIVFFRFFPSIRRDSQHPDYSCWSKVSGRMSQIHRYGRFWGVFLCDCWIFDRSSCQICCRSFEKTNRRTQLPNWTTQARIGWRNGCSGQYQISFINFAKFHY